MVKKNWSNPEVLDLKVEETKAKDHTGHITCNKFKCPLQRDTEGMSEAEIQRLCTYYELFTAHCTYFADEAIPEPGPGIS